MARISELHYSNTYASGAGGPEFVEVALQPGQDPADFVLGLYEVNGTVGLEVRLSDAGVTSQVDPDNGEIVYLISSDVFNFAITDPDSNAANNFEGMALTNTATLTLVDFYDIGAGDPQIVAVDGFAAMTGPAGTVGSEKLVPPTAPTAAAYSIQFNQPDPTTPQFIPVTRFDSGLACFVTGAAIMTPTGAVPVERLVAGDVVLTRDHGPQPLRWVGVQTVSGRDRFAPVRFTAGRYGATMDLSVSPQHRVLVTGWEAEMLFGEHEVLVPAKALVDDRYVRQIPCPAVTYHHLLFDTHQIVESHGFWSESYYPVARNGAGWSKATQAEVLAIFPHLGTTGYGALARQTIPAQLAKLLRHG